MSEPSDYAPPLGEFQPADDIDMWDEDDEPEHVCTHQFNQFFYETRNTQQIAVGISKPGVVFEYPLSRFDPEYVEVVKK